MSAAGTAAAIGLQIGADDKQAIKALADLIKNLDVLEAKATTVSGELRDLAVDGLEKVTFGAGRAAVSTAKWGLGLGALSATAATVGLIDMAKDFATGAATMGRSADRLGMPVDKLSQFGIAAHLAGSSAEAMQSGLQGLQATTADAAYGRNNEAWQAFRAAGIDVGDAKRGVIDDPGRMAKIADETQRLAKVSTNAAQRWLDMVGVGRELYPVLRNGSAGLQGYMDQAKSFHLTTPQDVQEARQLEQVIAGLDERFSSFARIGGAAVAPGLTKFLDTLGKYLAEHQEDVTEFFGEVEHGIEWLTTPKNMAWLKKELDDATEGVKELYHWAQQMEHSVIVRRLLGLPVEQSEVTGDHTPQRPGMPMEGEDDPAGVEGAKHAGGSTFFSRLWDTLTGDGGNPSGAVSGSTQAGMASLIKMGWQPGDAAGLLGNAQQESGLNPRAGAGTAHQGLFQWDDERRKAIEAHLHKPLMDMSFDEQLAAANWELREGKFKSVGDQLQSGSHEAGRSAAILDHYYEMPANPGSTELLKEDAKREANARLAMRSYDPGAQRMAADAQGAGAPKNAAPSSQDVPSTSRDVASSSAASEARLAKLRVEVHHINAPAGSSLHVTSDSPGYIDIDPPRTMGAMPDSGQQRNVVKEGW